MINSNSSDQELMEMYLAGAESAFEVIYQRYSGKIYSYLQKKLKNREEVDEVFQKVFLKFHSTRKNFNPEYPLLQWMYVVAKTTLLDHYRSQSRQIKTNNNEFVGIEESQEVMPETLVEVGELSLMAGLTNEQKNVLEMRIVDELPYDEIAKILNKSQASVRQIISRTLKKMKGAI